MNKEKIKINELFSGIGAQRKAFENLGLSYEIVGICEIDKYAIQSYNAIYGITRNYGDIITVPRLDYADIWTYSFPCQDISVAGNLKGINNNTRSGLLYQVQRLLEVSKKENTLPKYLLLKNVKNLVGKQFKQQFDEWIKYLDELGYKTYWQVLNAKNYGIPQNRERVFAVSIRKDLDQVFEFPKPEILNKKLLDILEFKVDESFYISDEKAQQLFSQISEKEISNTVRIGDRGSFDQHTWDLVAVKEATTKGYATAGIGDSINIEQPNSKTRRGRVGKEVAQTLTTSPQQVVIAASRGRNIKKTSDRTAGIPLQQRLEINKQGISNTITTVQKDNYVVENHIIQIGNIVDTSKTSWSNPIRGRIYSPEGISPTLNTVGGGGLEPKILFKNIRIRKLTPLECWRLMGFDDSDFYKAKQSGISNSQLYKQAGNSIVVNILEKIFINLFII